ncbi:T9SS type A sorting domain-containing protein [Flavobacterium sp. UBA7680]|uniref:T9SS type A sorting domain-containing protein n=1 Tax=Flavobacterium sp. UBA7680 TaxID=1946559 RepID=UPI0025B9D956|nr:T9SS type A sorting domain-containing protein [Flavobacterium sp. UBA7680]
MRSTLLYVLFLLNVQFAFCQWENLNTGLTDDLTGVVFFGNNGLVSGKKGLYYTSNGGEGASSWSRFEITDNAENAAVYANTTFTHCVSSTVGSASTGTAFACGQNTVTKQAIIIKIDLPSLQYTILYTGEVNSKLNQIAFSSYYGGYYAVGENGLLVSFTQAGVSRVKNLGTDNFSSITFYNSRCKIGTTGKILYTEYLDANYNFTEVLTPNADNKTVVYGSGTFSNGRTFSAGNRFSSYSIYNDLISSHTNYYGGTLNAKCILASTDNEHVGTDHGIYFVSNSQVLEWESTSSNYSINCFWKQAANPVYYACGNSGVILKNATGLSARVPYVNISKLEGVCAGNYLTLNGITGTVKSCKWFVNNVQVGSVCGNLSYLFQNVGTYEIKYTVTNYSDVESSDVKTIFVTPIPKINLPITISDNILCKSEPITIQIQNSEPDVVYTLRSGSSRFGTSGVGNGQTISFTSNDLTASGDYFLEAKNINATCTASFSDRFPITVEHTKAAFHTDLLNATANETATFYQKGTDAQNYKWDFSAGASVSTPGQAIQEVGFSKEGATTVNLEVWSDNGCYDQIEKEGPFIYNESDNPKECWTMVNNGVDSPWNGYEFEATKGITPTADGFLTFGGFNSQLFDSKIGLKYDLTDKKGGFLAKHDRKGALKWMIYTLPSPTERERDNILSSVVDADGNIYICGITSGDLIDNTGTLIDVNPLLGNYSTSGYIVKLDKNGKVIWTLSSTYDGYSPINIFLDKENNLISTGILNYLYSNQHQLYFNGVATTVINQNMITSQADNLTVLKIAPTGAVLWYTGINIRHVNGSGIIDVGFDNANNVYLTGVYENQIDFYSAGNTTTPETFMGNGQYDSFVFLAKYNKDGALQWKMKSGTKDAFFNGVGVASMVTDDNGNSYLTGGNGCDTATAVQYFENVDGSFTQTSIGAYYVAKVNVAGTCEWIMGDQHTTNSSGAKIIKDENLLHVLGYLGNSGSVTTSTLVSADGKNYDLTLNVDNFFMATYDLQGNLKKVITGESDDQSNVLLNQITGVFKAENDSFYISRNLQATNFKTFGDLINTNGIDGSVSHFTENCALVKYENTLSTEDFTKTSNAVIYPNPTSGKISVDLKNYDGNASVQIYDANGKKISEEKAVDLSKLDLTINGSQGLYFVKIKAGNKTQTFKVLKQ